VTLVLYPWNNVRETTPISQVVQAKCLMMCLSLTMDGNNQFSHPFTYAILGWWLVSVYVWLARMGKALKYVQKHNPRLSLS